ncbi:MAG TPA: Ku protein [Candidatus Methylomirabilis sp.]|nr:Ku protein [Candidatus Methylomirabilis sp.]
MASKLWSGSISFGLVNIPVSLVAAEAREELDFTLLDRRDDSPIGYQKINKRTGKPVPNDLIVRGFPYQAGRYVIVTDADLRRASPERTQRIDVLAFVKADEIPPTYFDRPYYLEPARGSDRGYALLREALRRSGKIAIATVVVKTRQHLAAVTVHDRVLVLDLLRYASQLRDPSKLRVPGTNLGAFGVSPRELRMAERLIEEMTTSWKPERYHDEYRDELLAFIRKRARTGKLAAAPEPEEPAPATRRAEVIDLAELLRKSLAGARARPERRRVRRRKTA